MSPSSAETQKCLPNELRGNAGFLLFWTASAAGVLGLGLAGAALAAQIADERQAAPQAYVFLVAAYLAVPVILAGPLAGWLADRLRRKELLASCSAAGGVVIVCHLAATAMGRSVAAGGFHWTLAAMGALLAVCLPAGAALLRVLVPRSQLLRAHALVGMTVLLALALATTLSATLVNRGGAGLCLALGAAVLIAGAVVFMLIRPVSGRAVIAPEHARTGGFWSGAAYVLGHSRVMRLGGLALLEWSAAAAFLSLLLAHGAGACDRQTTHSLACFSAAAGGMVLGTIIAAVIGIGLRGPFTTACSLIGAAVAALLAAATTPGPPIAAYVSLPALASWALLGLFVATALVGTHSVLPRIVPDFTLGRVLGLLQSTVAAGFFAVLLWIPRLGHDAGSPPPGPVLAGAGVALLIVGVYALAAELARSPFGRLIGFLYALNRFYCRWWFRLQREGPCRIPRRGPVIVAANHTATIDPLLLAACSPYRLIGFMTAAEYYNLPVFRHLLKRVGCIPVERTGHDAQSARAGLAHLEAGGALGIFPEGGIPTPGVERGAKKGVGMLALRTGATVVPVHISGTRWSPGVARAFFRRHRARVRFGRPVEATACRGREPVRQANQELADLILAEIREMKPPDR